MADFAVDSEKRHELAKASEEASVAIGTLTGDIYKGIDDMGGDGSDSWSGESYNTFQTMCKSYENSLIGLKEMLSAYGKIIGDQLDGPQEELETQLHDALD